jgi:hypothetical protein
MRLRYLLRRNQMGRQQGGKWKRRKKLNNQGVESVGLQGKLVSIGMSLFITWYLE